jgi:DNA-directed RNA polymerase specialized sigma24 family protein
VTSAAPTVSAVPLSPQAKRRLRSLAQRKDKLETEVAQAILEIRAEGGSLREIAKELDMSHGGVAWIERKARETGRLPEEET